MTLNGYLRSWGIPENDGKIVDRPLKTSLCNQTELGLVGVDDPNFVPDFFPVMENSLSDAVTYGPKLKCIDYEGFEFFGNFNSFKAK